MTRRIPLTRGQFTLVDDDDYAWLSQWRWNLSSANPRLAYACRSFKRGGQWQTVRMHRLILDAPDGVFVDHANGDKLDNRRSNIRLCTMADNMRNVPRTKPGSYRGVHKHSRRWRAMISIGENRVRLGSFATELEAAIAYDRMAREHHGEFAVLNFSADRDWLFPREHGGTWPPVGAQAARRLD
jgi:hypothetical protein